MKLEFRDLYADEIECRVGTVKEGKGFSLLLYKNARVDMALLDEVVGVGNWQREHKIIGTDVYCKVGIWNEELKQWIWREDAGAEANTEAEKSKASDSFKRACVNFGLGRCLYSSPFIWVTQDEENNPKISRYSVVDIEYKDHKITKLFIKNDKTGQVVFTFGGKKSACSEPKTPKDIQPSVAMFDNDDFRIIREYENNLPQAKKEQFSAWLFRKVGKTDIDKLTEEQAKVVANSIRGNN